MGVGHNMKRLIALLLLATSMWAQGVMPTPTTGVTASFTATGTSNPNNVINSTTAFYMVTWNTQGAPAACTFAVDSSANGSSWTAGGVLTNTTCTSSGHSAIISLTTNFYRINVSALTNGATLTVSVTGYNVNPVLPTGWGIGGGQLLMPDGLITAPALAFASDPTTGVYRSATSFAVTQGGAVTAGFSPSGLTLGSSKLFGWSTGSFAVPDATICRSATGLMIVGAGACTTGGYIKSAQQVSVASDVAITSVTAVPITGLQFTLPAVALNWSFHCAYTYSQATAAVSNTLAVGLTVTAPTNMVASGLVYTAAGTSTTGTVTITTTTITNILSFTPSATGTIFQAYIDGTVETAAGGGTLVFEASTGNAADTLTIKRDSYCAIW